MPVMKTLAIIAIVALSFVARPAAQQKPPAQKPTPTPAAVNPEPRPDFSGRWVVVSPARGAGREQIVTQTATSLTTEPANDPTRRTTYALDGVEHRVTLPTHGMEITNVYKATWDGPRIVITSQLSYPNGMKTQSTETWSIDPQARLVIDYVERGPGGPGPTEHVIYTRKK